MWSYKKNRKNRENREKGIVINSGGTFKLPLPPVRFDRGKCFVLVNGKEILLDEDGFIVMVQVQNSRPLRIKIFPDFKNRTFNAIEIIDVDDHKEYPENEPKIVFSGLSRVTREDIEKYLVFLKQEIKRLNEDMFKLNKRIRRTGYIVIIVLSIIVPIQLYFAYVSTGIWRYIYIALIMIGIACVYMNIWAIKRANKMDRSIKADNKEDVIESAEMNKAEIVKDT